MIACLAWGSLVWDPRSLPMSSEWRADGPGVCVDYFRQSKDGRLTLVLDRSAPISPSLWCLLTTTDLAEASQALALREGMPSTKRIGVWSIGDNAPATIKDLDTWAASKNLDHVVWTDLPPKFNNQPTPPTAEAAVAYLRNLPSEASTRAEEYVRRTPPQIQTVLRRAFERELQWAAV